MSHAIFVHCYAYKLNLVLSQSVSFIKECKVYFRNLSSLGKFFSKSMKTTAALHQEVKKRFTSVASTRSNYSSQLIETVFEYCNKTEKFMNSIIENSDK